MHNHSRETIVMSNNPFQQHLNPLGAYNVPPSAGYQIGLDSTSGLRNNAGSTPLSNFRDSDKPGSEGAEQNVNDSFPCKLHLMLQETEEQGLEHVVSWQPHGRSFAVHRRRDFVDHIMPSYFRMSKFASFQRQLNLYGFSRFTAGRDKGGYYHELFLRGRRDLCYDILRRKVKGTGARKPAAPESEPNFYRLPYMPLNTKKPAVIASQLSSAGVTGMMNSSFLLPQNQPTSAPTAAAMPYAQEHSLVSMAAIAPREMFANMLDPSSSLSRRSSMAAGYQLQAQQPQSLDQRRLSLLSGPVHADRRFSFFSNPFEQFPSPSTLEPIQLPREQQQQQLQLQQLQRQQLQSNPFLHEETDGTFDAAIAALMRMDPNT